jgi:hypothetical protein
VYLKIGIIHIYQGAPAGNNYEDRKRALHLFLWVDSVVDLDGISYGHQKDL